MVIHAVVIWPASMRYWVEIFAQIYFNRMFTEQKEI